MKLLIFIIGAMFGAVTVILWMLMIALGQREERENNRW